MSNSILDMVGQQLSGNTVNQISQQLGSDPNSTAQAIQMALPMLVGGLAHNAQNPQGAAALDTALESHDPGLLDNVAGLLGGGGAGGAASGLGGALGGMLGGGSGGGGGGLGGLLGSVLAGGAGAGILGHVLGGRQPAVEQGIGRATGMNQQQVGKLLLLLAPLVMAALARRRQQAQAAGTPANVGDVLHEERQQVEQRAPAMGGLLGKIFGGAGGQPAAGGVDLDGDGIADEIGRTNPGGLGGLLGGLLGGR